MQHAGYRLTKKLKLGLVVGLVCLLCIFGVSNTIAQTGSGSSQLPNPIRIGVRDAAYPIGNHISQSSVVGFCGVFGQALKDKLKIEVKYKNIENEYLDNNYHRFDGLRIGVKNKIEGSDIECGPNSSSIQENTLVAGDIEFSDRSFYSTGMKLLLKEGIAREISQDLKSLKKYVIGYVENTSTSEKFSKVEDIKVQPFPTREKALDALELGTEIQIYASDGIILRSLLRQGLTQRNDLFPSKKFPSQKGKYITGNEATEHYVMAIAKNSPYHETLKTAIDEVLSLSTLVNQKESLLEYEDQSISLGDLPPTSDTEKPPPPPQKNHFMDSIPGIILVLIAGFIQVKSGTLSTEGQKKLATLLAFLIALLGVAWIAFHWGH
jgi:Bacterial extracellular solute-binding proteins, family 3